MSVDSSALSNLRIFFSWGEATSSGNRDAVSGSWDSFCMEPSAACTPAGSSSHTSSHVATSFAPCLIRVFGPQEFLLVTLPGTAYTSRFCSRAQREVMRVPLYSAASTTSTPADIPLIIRLRMGKFCGAGKVPTGNSEISAPPRATICSASRVFSLGYMTSIPVPRAATVFPLAAMAPRCDAVSMPRAMPLMITSPRAARVNRQALGHAAAVRCRMSSPHHHDSGLGQHLNIPFHEEDHRWVVDFLQPRRVFRIAERNNLAPDSAAFAHSGCANSSDFPVDSDCAETERIPVASSSVRLA